MTNPEWGIKRICQSCATKFYDLQHDPIRCPKCQTEYDPEAFLKTRRSRPAVTAEKQAAATDKSGDADTEAVDTEAVEASEDEEDVADIEESGEDEDEDVMEDASELGEDDDDMAEVIDNVDEDDER